MQLPTNTCIDTHIDYQGLNELFTQAHRAGRSNLFEHEVYRFFQMIGSETPPQFYLLSKSEKLDRVKLNALPGQQVVIKVVSLSILHKSDVGGVRIVAKTENEVRSAIAEMQSTIPLILAELVVSNPQESPPHYRNLAETELLQVIRDDIKGYLICQYMRPDSEEFGNELLVSLRNSREFGMIITAGLGGRDTELYAARFKKGQAIVSASTHEVDGRTFFELFRQTISYKKMAGLTRGQKRIVTENQLHECFEALIQVGNYFTAGSNGSTFVIEELEVNPFAFSNYLMMPLDGLCRFSTRKKRTTCRPIEKINQLLHPTSLAIAGISTKHINVGRIILDNVLANGYPPGDLTLIHPDALEIDSIRTVPDLAALPQKVDLLILAITGKLVPTMIDQIIAGDLAESVILISSTVGESDTQESLVIEIQAKLDSNRTNGKPAPILLGANSLGILSHPGRYDAMFIPEEKLQKNRGKHTRSLALVSQSGAYLVTRMSTLSFLDPAYAISIGNQIDLTSSDFLSYFNQMKDLNTLAFYLEGFTDNDGLLFSRAIRTAVRHKKEVICYKAGRTPEGKSALSGHTASIAGDYMVCDSCIYQAGAMVAETFSVFEGLLRLSCTLYNKTISNNKLAAISNAGYEAVGIADNILGADYRLEMATFSSTSSARLESLLLKAKLDTLTTVNNPLDITPMASEKVYLEVIETLLKDENIGSIIVAIVPLTPLLHTLPEQIAENSKQSSDTSIVEQVASLNSRTNKPLVMVVDSGKLYDPLADALQQHGLPVFRSADIAVSVLGKYIHNRLRNLDREK